MSSRPVNFAVAIGQGWVIFGVWRVGEVCGVIGVSRWAVARPAVEFSGCGFGWARFLGLRDMEECW